MINSAKIGDELYYLDRTHGIYRCVIQGIIDTNGIISYRDNRNMRHYPENLFYTKKDVVEAIPTNIQYTDIPDLPAGTDFKYGDKVYFVDINPYMIHDAILNFVEKSQSSTYSGYCYKYRGAKKGYNSESIFSPFATLQEVKEHITYSNY